MKEEWSGRESKVSYWTVLTESFSVSSKQHTVQNVFKKYLEVPSIFFWNAAQSDLNEAYIQTAAYPVYLTETVKICYVC